MQGLELAEVSTNPRKQIEHLQKLGLEPGTLYQELEMESRYVDTHRDTSFSNSQVNLHSHTFYEVLYCRITSGAEYLVGAERYQLQPGDVVIIPPGISHRPLLPPVMPEPYTRDVLWISLEFLSGMRSMFVDEHLLTATGPQLIRTAGTRWEFLGELFRQGVQEAESRDVGWEAAVAANTIQIIVSLRRAILARTAKQLKAEKPELLDQAMAYIESHLQEKLSPGEVARHFYVSESTISQLFRKKMGVSFHRCVTQRRLIAAKSLIEQGLRMEEVGQQVGFSDYSTFYRAFRHRDLRRNVLPVRLRQ